MRHLKRNRKFGRERNQRRAFLIHLMNALILQGKIKTTLSRAKEIKRLIDKNITVAKKDNLSSFRQLRKRFPERVVKALRLLGANYKTRTGGYSRIIKLPPRKSDGARMAIIELV